MIVERADFDDLVTLVTQAPTWEKDRAAGVRILLRAIGEGKADAPDQILSRWTWRLARATRKLQDRRASAEFPEAKRLLGALANSRGHRHEENAARLVNAALELPMDVGAALLASGEGYTPRANQLISTARDRLGSIQEVAHALAENLPAPKAQPGRSRRRRRRRKKKGQTEAAQLQVADGGGGEAEGSEQPEGEASEAGPDPGTNGAKPKRRRRRKPQAQQREGEGEATPEPAAAAEA
jgi:hypothetical protein